MKNVLVGLIFSSALALPAMAALKTGASAPDFSAPASVAGKDYKFSLEDALKKGPVVVYFYPSAASRLRSSAVIRRRPRRPGACRSLKISTRPAST